MPAKGRYMFIDLKRFADRYGVPFAAAGVSGQHLNLMRGVMGTQLRAPERFEALLKVLFEGMWVQQRNLSDAAVLEQP
jgi:2-hydroxychromene-2-carboxylate isomerase